MTWAFHILHMSFIKWFDKLYKIEHVDNERWKIVLHIWMVEVNVITLKPVKIQIIIDDHYLVHR